MAESEYFRYNLKTNMWEGLQQYAISGHNTGPCPYGYAEERTTHPNPMKASMGATRAPLAELIPASQAQQDDLDHARSQTLTRKLAQTETALDGIAAELGQLAGKTDKVSQAIRLSVSLS